MSLGSWLAFAMMFGTMALCTGCHLGGLYSFAEVQGKMRDHFVTGHPEMRAGLLGSCQYHCEAACPRGGGMQVRITVNKRSWHWVLIS